jgi:hypothetical protein
VCVSFNLTMVRLPRLTHVWPLAVWRAAGACTTARWEKMGTGFAGRLRSAAGRALLLHGAQTEGAYRWRSNRARSQGRSQAGGAGFALAAFAGAGERAGARRGWRSSHTRIRCGCGRAGWWSVVARRGTRAGVDCGVGPRVEVLRC